MPVRITIKIRLFKIEYINLPIMLPKKLYVTKCRNGSKPYFRVLAYAKLRLRLKLRPTCIKYKFGRFVRF